MINLSSDDDSIWTCRSQACLILPLRPSRRGIRLHRYYASVKNENIFFIHESIQVEEDVIKGGKLNFSWNFRKILPKEIKYGLQLLKHMKLFPRWYSWKGKCMPTTATPYFSTAVKQNFATELCQTSYGSIY